MANKPFRASQGLVRICSTCNATYRVGHAAEHRQGRAHKQGLAGRRESNRRVKAFRKSHDMSKYR